MIRAAILVFCLALAACAAETDPAANGDAEKSGLPAPAAAPSADEPLGPGPDELLHLSDDEVRQILGEPAFVWGETGAALWRYRGKDCYLDLFLYPDEGVTFVEVHGDNLDGRARQTCYQSLVKPAAG